MQDNNSDIIKDKDKNATQSAAPVSSSDAQDVNNVTEDSDLNYLKHDDQGLESKSDKQHQESEQNFNINEPEENKFDNERNFYQYWNKEDQERKSNRTAKTNFVFNSTEQQVKKKQNILMTIIAAVIILILLVVFKNQFLPKRVKVDQLQEEKALEATKIETASDNIDPDQMWRYKMSEENKKSQSQISEIKDAFNNQIKDQKDQDKEEASKIEELSTKISKLENNMITGSSEHAPPVTQAIDRTDINLPGIEKKKIDTVDTVIPAGAFAKAVLLSGVDAPTALSASSNTMPILIRITDPGTLPRKFQSDLEDCHVIASSYGDLSSERVYGRLDKLTCTERTTGEIIETDVKGFIAGEDGKAGLRGKVVAKEAGYLANSLVGGVIGGFSSTMAPTTNVPLISSGTIQGPSASTKFQQGFGNGMSSSMDRLSKYYIDRAESLQPVIEISAGRIIDIVFLEKALIGTSQVKQELAAVRDQQRLETAHNIAEKENFNKG